jgi:hypothetical protein
MNGPSLEDIDATRCVEHWYIQQKGHIKSIWNQQIQRDCQKRRKWTWLHGIGKRKVCNTFFAWFSQNLARS